MLPFLNPRRLGRHDLARQQDVDDQPLLVSKPGSTAIRLRALSSAIGRPRRAVAARSRRPRMPRASRGCQVRCRVLPRSRWRRYAGPPWSARDETDEQVARSRRDPQRTPPPSDRSLPAPRRHGTKRRRCARSHRHPGRPVPEPPRERRSTRGLGQQLPRQVTPPAPMAIRMAISRARAACLKEQVRHVRDRETRKQPGGRGAMKKWDPDRRPAHQYGRNMNTRSFSWSGYFFPSATHVGPRLMATASGVAPARNGHMPRVGTHALVPVRREPQVGVVRHRNRVLPPPRPRAAR